MLNAPQMKNPDGCNRQGLDSVNPKQGNQPMSSLPQLPANESLIPVIDGEIGGIEQPVVNARELHTWLKNGDMFAHWIKSRIAKYDFVENEDFACYWEISQTQRKSGQRGMAKVKIYALTLNMAKELAMVENNPQGKTARRYFLRCEKALHEVNNSLMLQFNRALVEFEKFSALASDAGRTLAIVGKQYKPAAKGRADDLKKKIQPLLPWSADKGGDL